ncbi:MAG: hypothetical protein CFH14_00189 [Alphaproteobacteria bacterium MarineAlpha5_Bin4]|nr:MAG: hypothetical protein CFH14_00189 [Alphaproteobacteria bacterium MarineAlpha5_Bin4]
MKNILFIGIFHETNCFIKQKTLLKDFEILKKKEILNLTNDFSQISGFLNFCKNKNLNVFPTVSFTATPSGIVENKVFEIFWKKFIKIFNQIKENKFDAIFLSLHGAMVTDKIFDVEGELLKRLKKIKTLKNVPVFGVFDLHANFTKKMAKLSNALICYQKNPHIDSYKIAYRAAKIMYDSLNKKLIPKTYYMNAKILWSPSGTSTLKNPMRKIESEARKYEKENENIIAINVIAGFAYSDVPENGVAFSVIATNYKNVSIIIKKLVLLANKLKLKGLVKEYDLKKIITMISSKKFNQPVLLIESADNIGGGSPGNTTDVMRSLISNNIKNSGVIINDPLNVKKLKNVKVGDFCKLIIGDMQNYKKQNQMILKVKLINKTNGRFTLEDKQSHLAASRGEKINMGNCALVQCSGVYILLTSIKTPPFDLGQWKSQGLDPAKLTAIGVKAAAAYRQAYDKISRISYNVKTSGPCQSDLNKIKYKNVIKKSFFPLNS